MRRDTINYTVVGTFVVILFIAFLMVLYQITGRTGPVDNYYVYYGNVEGIKYGTPVLYEGYQIGQVDLVDPVKEAGGTEFKLTLSVIRGWQIPVDSVAAVVKSGLLSAVAINIEEGKSQEPLKAESVLEGKEAADLFAAMNDVAADIRDLSRNSIRPLLDNLNKQVDVVVADVRSVANDDLKPLLTKLNKSAEKLMAILSEQNKENIDRILSNLETSSGDLGTLIRNVEQTRTTLDRIVVNVDRLIDENDEEMDSTLKDLKKSMYTVSQHIDAVVNDLEGSSRNMYEFTRQIRDNPSVLLRGTAPPDEEEQQ